MNKKQAEHLLDIYVRMRMRELDRDVIDALREMIVDAMTEDRGKSDYPNITYPYGTGGDQTKFLTNWDGSPRVTCTGIDPAFGINPATVGQRIEDDM